MIQRMQSVYLLVAAVAVGLVFIFDLFTQTTGAGTLTVSVMEASLSVSGQVITSLTEGMNYVSMVLMSIVILVSLASIFLFGNRSLQARLAKLGVLINLGLLVALIFTVEAGMSLVGNLELDTSGYNYVAFVLPIFSAASCYLAFRAILKDEALVRASDRLR